MSLDNLQEIAQDAIKQALAAGATDAECTLSEGSEFSASVRLGEVETLKEAGSRGAGLRVLIGKRADGRYMSYFGDVHPSYFGNVVKAIGSAKEGYPVVSQVLARISPTSTANDSEFVARSVGALDA